MFFFMLLTLKNWRYEIKLGTWYTWLCGRSVIQLLSANSMCSFLYNICDFSQQFSIQNYVILVINANTYKIKIMIKGLHHFIKK